MFSWLTRLVAGPPDPLALQQSRAEDPTVRELGAKSLGEIPEVWSVAALLRLLTDTYSSVREAAKASLIQLNTNSVPGLLEGLNHANPELGKTCAEILGEIKSPETVEPLIVALKFASRPVQLACRKALEKFGPPAKAQLESARNESQPWVRSQIEGILATM